MPLFVLAVVVFGLVTFASALAQPLKPIPVHAEARVGLRRIDAAARQRMQ